MAYGQYKRGKRNVREFRQVPGSNNSKWASILPVLYALFSAMIGSQVTNTPARAPLHHRRLPGNTTNAQALRNVTPDSLVNRCPRCSQSASVGCRQGWPIRRMRTFYRSIILPVVLPHARRIDHIFRCVCAGQRWRWQSVLMAKTLSELLRTTMTGDYGALTSWFTYAILVAFIGTASFWATRLNKSLQLFPALIIVPLMQVSG
eukprot:4799409-Pyramimonas_sp.AAC.1